MTISSPLSTAAAILALSAVSAAQDCPPPALPDSCDALIEGTPLPWTNSAAPELLTFAPGTTVDVLILGHSESAGYAAPLQTLLDQNPPLPGVTFQVTNFFIGGTEAWKWATPGENGYAQIESILDNFSGAVIVLGLFSNNATFPISNPVEGDEAYDGFVADLEAIADHLWDGGQVARVIYFSAHRYKVSNVLPSWNENCAIQTLMANAETAGKDYIKPGPAQHDLHWCCFPTCYAPDQEHTNFLGDQLMADTWYAFLVRELTGCATHPFGQGTLTEEGVEPFLDVGGGFPTLGNDQYRIAAKNAPPQAPVLFFFGEELLPGPFWVQPDWFVAGSITNPLGFVVLSLPIPATPALAGLTVNVQAAIVNDVPEGYSLTNALAIALCE